MSNKKRILFFDGSLEQGGAERVIHILSEKMLEYGADVTIMTYFDRDVFYKMDSRIKIVCVQSETKTECIMKNIIWMHKYMKLHADIIISFLAVFNILAIIAKTGLNIPIIVADRNDPRCVPEKKYIRLVRDFLYRFADRVVLQTEYNAKYFSRSIQKKSRVIPNPTNLGQMAGAAQKTDKRKEIVSVGRLVPQKNQKNLLEAFSRVHKKHQEYVLTIYGDGPLKDELLELARELDIHDNVRFPGSVHNIYEMLVGAEMFVLSSDYEGMPNALIEAMCIGTPVVSTKVSGAVDLIINGKNGFLVEKNNPEELAEKINILIENSEIEKDFSEHSIKLNDELSADRICQVWIDIIYESLN